MGLQCIQLLTLFSQERVFVSLHLNGHVNLVRNLMYESLWFLKRGVWNMLPLPGNACVCFLGTSARGDLKEKGLESTCAWSCYQDKGSALLLCDSDPDTPRWLLE